MRVLKTLDAVADAVKQNQVGLFPCDTIWGLVGRVNLAVSEKLMQIKSRPETNPFLIVISNTSVIENWAQPLRTDQKALMEKHWPGPLTLVFEKKSSVPEFVTQGKPTIAIRLPHFAPLNALLNLVQEPLFSTSPNKSGEPTPKIKEEINSFIYENVDFIYENETPPLGKESTIVDVSQTPFKVLRQGVLFL